MALTPNTVNQYLNEALDRVAADKDRHVKNPGVDFTRNRKLPFKTMMRLFLEMSGGSLPKEMMAFWDRTNVPVTKSAFVQQRNKIRPSAFTELFKIFNSLCAPSATMYGRRLYAFDGTSVNIAPNPGTETYIERKDQTGFSQYHLNASYDLCSNVYTDYVQQEAHAANEQRAACQMIDRLSATTKTIAIFDRGYEGYNLIAHVQEAKNVDILLRMKETGGILSGISDLPDGEFDIDYEREVATTQTKEDKAKGRAYISAKKNKNTNYSPKTKYREWDFPSPFKLKFRIVRFKLKNGFTETIMTTLPRNEFPPKVIKELYNMRWGIETSFRDLKYVIGMVHLHSKGLESSMIEIFAALVKYNYCSYVINQAVVPAAPKNGKGPRKHLYRINHKAACEICLTYLRERRTDQKLLMEQIQFNTEPVRPDRPDTRKSIKPKQFVYFAYRVAA